MTEATIQKISFEHVSAIRYPQYYRGDHPCVAPADVPDEHWSQVERSGDGIAAQRNGLMLLMAHGELIRNVRTFEAAVLEPHWREVTT